MHKAGLSIHQMRICQPYGDDQRRGLNLYHVIEPLTWSRVVARVAGANQGAMYAGKRGNILGNGYVELPPGHTWSSFVEFLLASLPEAEADNYRDKIAVFTRWWANKHGQAMTEDDLPELEGRFKKQPTWKRVARAILKNDHMCKSLGFSQQRTTAGSFDRYKKIMRARRAEWGIYKP